MTPKVLYSTLFSIIYIEISTPRNYRPKNVQTAEMNEEYKRQQSTFRVIYQRESDIPRVPHDNFSSTTAEIVIIPSHKIVPAAKTDMNSQSYMMMQNAPIQGIMPGNIMDPSYVSMMMTPSMPMPMYLPKIINTNTRPINYRTEACKNFHSAAGCTHGDACHFIHDFDFEGRPIPNMAEWRKNNQTRNKNIETMKNMQMGFPMYYPPSTEPHIK